MILISLLRKLSKNMKYFNSNSNPNLTANDRAKNLLESKENFGRITIG